MRRVIAAVGKASAAACAGMLLAVLNAPPAAAQGNSWAAVAFSESTLNVGESHMQDSQADALHAAIDNCQANGPKDCKIVYSHQGDCEALATTMKAVPNKYGGGWGSTRELAAGQALASCAKAGGIGCVVRMTPCSSDDPRWASPLPLPSGGKPGSVDPGLVGLWKLNVGSGIWVWQISANGTYTFHSDAPDHTPSHNGTFTAGNGKYTLHAISMQWDDQGTYSLQGSAAVSMTGNLGTGTWYRITSDPNP